MAPKPPGWRGPPGKAVAHRGNARRPRPRLRCAAALGFPLSPVDRLDADAVDVDEMATQPAPTPRRRAPMIVKACGRLEPAGTHCIPNWVRSARLTANSAIVPTLTIMWYVPIIRERPTSVK